MLPTLRIKKEREHLLRRKHPWLFSKALETIPADLKPGDLCRIEDSSGRVWGYGWVNPHTDLAFRFLSFDVHFSQESFFKERLSLALKDRLSTLAPGDQAYRLINGEADGLPGLIIDIYDSWAVVQISTQGAFRHVKDLLEWVQESMPHISYVYEKSSAKSRVLESLPEQSYGFLWMENVQEVSDLKPLFISEHGLRYRVDPIFGQKTGFFLDQRHMRLAVRSLSKDRTILNGFCYSGGFSLNALLGKAKKVISVDSSEKALLTLKDNLSLNELAEDLRHQSCLMDVLEFLKSTTQTFDGIIIDPPPYIKKAKDLHQGLKLYEELQRLALKKLNPQGWLMTFSCSPFLSEENFYEMVLKAVTKSSLNMAVIGHHRHGWDHPVLIQHSEGRYLKGLILKDRGFR